MSRGGATTVSAIGSLRTPIPIDKKAISRPSDQRPEKPEQTPAPKAAKQSCPHRTPAHGTADLMRHDSPAIARKGEITLHERIAPRRGRYFSAAQGETDPLAHQRICPGHITSQQDVRGGKGPASPKPVPGMGFRLVRIKRLARSGQRALRHRCESGDRGATIGSALTDSPGTLRPPPGEEEPHK